MAIDFKKEQEATLARPRMKYGFLANLLFFSMDLMYGKKTTYPKVKFLETLARIPYQSWEIKQYRRVITCIGNEKKRKKAEDIIKWSREAHDNEYWHLLVASEKIRQDKVKDGWFRYHFIPPLVVLKYTFFSRMLAFISIKSAWKLNAEFEDHAEHTFMQFVKDNPQLEDEQVESEVVQDGRGSDSGRYSSWADVFRRMGLDERDHMNESLKLIDKGDKRVHYLS